MGIGQEGLLCFSCFLPGKPGGGFDYYLWVEEAGKKKLGGERGVGGGFF